MYNQSIKINTSDRKKGAIMTYRNDTFIPDLLVTFGTIGAIVMLVFTYSSGHIQTSMLLYIIAAVLITVTNLITFVPLYTIAFIILKLLGSLTFGWPWIILMILIDALLEISVNNVRSQV